MFISTWRTNTDYFEALRLMASLSELFSDSKIPFLDYRLAENIFCRFFEAQNEARSCTAYDARLGSLGVGIKTFILKNNHSLEKVAEFNRLKPQLDGLMGEELARRLGEFRNDRIRFADDTYGTSERLYHIVGRVPGALRIFNTSYDKIDIENIKVSEDNNVTLSFEDGRNEYTFNRSKSVLMKRFKVSEVDAIDVPVEIFVDPLSLLFEKLRIRIKKGKSIPIFASTVSVPGVDYVILPYI